MLCAKNTADARFLQTVVVCRFQFESRISKNGA